MRMFPQHGLLFVFYVASMSVGYMQELARSTSRGLDSRNYGLQHPEFHALSHDVRTLTAASATSQSARWIVAEEACSVKLDALNIVISRS